MFHQRHDFVAGAMENVKYTDCRISLRPGARLFVYTDGLLEATNAEGKMFGEHRVLATLREAQDGTPEEILTHMRSAVDDFVGEAEQFDDLTMFCLEYKGARPASPSAQSPEVG